jgi:hypothetical protein
LLLVVCNGLLTGDLADEYEFGGPIGAVALMIFSHTILYYLWLSWRYHNAEVFVPSQVDWYTYLPNAIPNLEACFVYGAFFVGQVLMTWLIPGDHVKVC